MRTTVSLGDELLAKGATEVEFKDWVAGLAPDVKEADLEGISDLTPEERKWWEAIKAEAPVTPSVETEKKTV